MPRGLKPRGLGFQKPFSRSFFCTRSIGAVIQILLEALGLVRAPLEDAILLMYTPKNLTPFSSGVGYQGLFGGEG
jgi:hypothetical protein